MSLLKFKQVSFVTVQDRMTALLLVQPVIYITAKYIIIAGIILPPSECLDCAHSMAMSLVNVCIERLVVYPHDKHPIRSVNGS